MKVYLDSNFVCSTAYDPEKIEVETDYFSGKCKEYIEGYRYIPEGYEWTHDNGTLVKGLYVAPWKPYSELDQAQREYERAQLADMKAALELLGVTLDE